MRLMPSLAISVLVVVLSASASAAGPLVDGAWLEQRLHDPELRVVDVRSGLDGGSYETYLLGHVPGAVHTDYLRAGWTSIRAGVQGMLPKLDKLEVLVGNLGIDEEVHVVLVPAGRTAADYASATRIYWTLKVLGHDAVSILDGGHALWVEQGRPLEQGAVAVEPRLFEVDLRAEPVAERAQVSVAAASGRLVDNRPVDQFQGRGEQHPWVARAGAIPGASNLPHHRFVDRESGRFVAHQQLAALWAEVAGPGDGDIVTYCNTGYLASIGWFTASELLGLPNVRLYDGSMTDWTSDPANAVVASAWSQANVARSLGE